MCAPRDQRKSSDAQHEQAELNALRCPRRAEVISSASQKFALGNFTQSSVQFAECLIWNICP